MHAEELDDEITALEHRLAEAEQSGNRAALHHLVAADYSGVNALGCHVDRETFVEAFLSPELKIEELHLANIVVRVFEHVAIASGISTAHGLVHQVPFRNRYHYTNVWVHRLMHWELVASHVSPASGP